MDMEMNNALEPETAAPTPAAPAPVAPAPVTPVPNFTYAPYEPKPLFDLKSSDTAFAVAAVAASVFTSIFGLFGGFALGYSLATVLMIGVFLVYFAKQGKVSVSAVVFGVLALANSVVFVNTTNGSVRFFAFLVGFLLALSCFDGMVNGPSQGNRGSLDVFFAAGSTLGNIAATVKSLFSDKDGGKKTFGKVLLGLLCAVPALIVILPLLMSSDDAFRGMMNNIFDNTASTVFKTVFGVGLSVFVVTYGFSLKARRTVWMPEGKFGGIENVYVISFLSAIAVCYVMYLFSQLAYFFSAFQGFLPNGEITYAQYARKGFFEMCVIAVINLGLVFAALLLSKKQNGKVCHAIKAITTFISLFTLLIIATALSKMVLYIGTYGMTVLRLTTSAFMVFLAVVFLSVILRIYCTKINIVKTALITAGCVILVLGACNVNAVCAKYNYESYMSGKLDSIDVSALYYLGDEGIPYLTELAYDEEEDVALRAQEYLAEAYIYDYFEDMDDLESFTVDMLKQRRRTVGFGHYSIPKAKAYDALYKFLEDNPTFDAESRAYLNLRENDVFF